MPVYIMYVAGPPPTSPVELERLGGEELAELARLYMQDNQQLRRDNADLFSAREGLLRDQELLCRENERLLKKLEDVNLYVNLIMNELKAESV